MSIMTDIWTVFGVDQGQAVRYAYRYDADGDRVVCRRIDADGAASYAAAACPADLEWVGYEGDHEARGLEYAPIPADPFR
jgi:hypothetical protein